MSIFDGMLGPPTERECSLMNQRKGRAAENQVEIELRMEYDEVKRVHEGADFVARNRDWVTGEVLEETKVEVKAIKSNLTERQRKERRKSGNYEVRRRDPFIY